MPPARKRTAKKSSAKKRTSAKKRSSAKKTASSKRTTSAKRTSSAKRTTSAKKTTAPKQTTSAQSAPMPKAVEEATERIRELNEQIIERGRSAGLAYLDAYERALGSISDYQRKLASAAEGGRADWLAALLKAQADYTRAMAESVSAYVRQSLRQG